MKKSNAVKSSKMMTACHGGGQSHQEEEKVPQTLRQHSSQIRDVDGDLMTSSDSLCHCVSECLNMGKGIAVLFKEKYG